MLVIGSFIHYLTLSIEKDGIDFFVLYPIWSQRFLLRGHLKLFKALYTKKPVNLLRIFFVFLNTPGKRLEKAFLKL